MNCMIFRGRESMTVVILVLAALILAACMPVQAQPDVGVTAQEEDMEAVINHIWTEYAEANMALDSERWIAIWDENAVKLPPGGLPVVGRDAIYARKVAGNKEDASLDIDIVMKIMNEEFEVAGDWAWCRGTYTYETTPKAGGDTTHFEGKYMDILHKQPDGSWKIYRDIYNANSK